MKSRRAEAQGVVREAADVLRLGHVVARVEGGVPVDRGRVEECPWRNARHALCGVVDAGSYWPGVSCRAKGLLQGGAL